MHGKLNYMHSVIGFHQISRCANKFSLKNAGKLWQEGVKSPGLFDSYKIRYIPKMEFFRSKIEMLDRPPDVAPTGPFPAPFQSRNPAWSHRPCVIVQRHRRRLSFSTCGSLSWFWRELLEGLKLSTKLSTTINCVFTAWGSNHALCTVCSATLHYIVHGSSTFGAVM